MRYNADFAPQRYNLGNLAVTEQDIAGAIAHYRKAIAIDSRFYPAKVNLASLYNRQGQNREAEQLLKEVLRDNPRLFEVSYSLGLLLAEMRKYREAEHYLGQAASGLRYGRAYYNQGQVLLVLKEPARAEQAFLQALALSPGDRQSFSALSGLYLTAGQPAKAKALAERILREAPDNTAAQAFLQRLGQ